VRGGVFLFQKEVVTCVSTGPWLFAPEQQILLGDIVRLELIDIGPSTFTAVIAALATVYHKLTSIGKQATFGVRIKCSAITLS